MSTTTDKDKTKDNNVQYDIPFSQHLKLIDTVHAIVGQGKSPLFVGIDLGTTFCAVSTLKPNAPLPGETQIPKPKLLFIRNEHTQALYIAYNTGLCCILLYLIRQ